MLSIGLSRLLSVGALRLRKTAMILGICAIGALPSDSAAANPKYSGIVVDAKTGRTLYSYKSNTTRFPASLTKIMTLYVLFEELEAGRMSLNTPLKVSKHAAGQAPSKIGFKPGQTITVRNAIRALVTKSANDVATAVAENVSGSEKKFAQRMTRTARQIGMSRTTFRNPHGLPNSGQKTTAKDMAILGRAIQERFPSYYKHFSTRTFSYRGRKYGNHNKLLGTVRGVDGIKTGYIRASGFNLVTSVNRDGRHIVAVVMGGRTSKSRNAQMKKLIGRYLHKAKKGKKRSYVLTAAQRRGSGSINLALKNAPLPPHKPVQTLTVAALPLQAPVAVAPAMKAISPAAKAFATEKTIASVVNEATATAVPKSRTALDPTPTPRSRISQSFEVAKALPPMRKPVQGQSDPISAVIAQAPIAAPSQTVPKPQELQEFVSTHNSQSPVSGWQVQIAATPTQTGAIKLLKTAQAKVGSPLRRYDRYTEPVNAKGETLYRARFVGFDNKSAAVAACRSLKKAKYACYTIYQ